MERRNSFKLCLSALIILSGQTIYAAQPVKLNHTDASVLQTFMHPTQWQKDTNLKEINRSEDLNHTLHIRFQETFNNVPVFGADGVLHVPGNNWQSPSFAQALTAAKTNKQASMNGTLYTNIQHDVAATPATYLTEENGNKLLQLAIATYQQQLGKQVAISDKNTQLIVYVDKNHVAHYAFQIQFYAQPANVHALPAKPVYIMDAITGKIYRHWNEIKTSSVKPDFGGGYGGNKKMGKRSYDGLENNFPKLNILRDSKNNVCWMQNDEVTVYGYDADNNMPGAIMTFQCSKKDADHNNVYWEGDIDAVNDGYSPMNDALFGGAVIKAMYQDWYKVPVLVDSKGKPMMLKMVVHDPIDNAYWDGKQMTFGDGVSYFYPLTSLGVAAHEISHGFTEQHSNLTYDGQSGGLNESYSDMAAQAAEVYAYGVGKNSWQIGPEIFKAPNEALRYMDMPSKDCPSGSKPGDWCSIDKASQYYDGLDVHFSSGVFNRLFYLIATSKNWDVQKTFNVMVYANMTYWTSDVTFDEAGCGVLSATKYWHGIDPKNYDTKSVLAAFKTVEIDASNCGK